MRTHSRSGVWKILFCLFPLLTTVIGLWYVGAQDSHGGRVAALESMGDDLAWQLYLPFMQNEGEAQEPTFTPTATATLSATSLPVTATPTFTPFPVTATFTPWPPTATSTPTATFAATYTPTPLPICPTQFAQEPIANQTFVLVTGDYGEVVTLTNLTTGMILGTSMLSQESPPDFACDHFTHFNNNLPPLVAGHVLLVESENGTSDTTIVLSGTPTPSPTFTPFPATPTFTPTPLSTVSSTPTSRPTITGTPTPTSTIGPTATPTPLVTATPTIAATSTQTPMPTSQPTATATATALPVTATSTATATWGPTPTATATATPTPSEPYIGLWPTCAAGPTIQFAIFGANWPSNRSISILWDTDQLVLTIPQGNHNGSFSRQIIRNNVVDGSYEVVARASGPGGETATALFTVPCPVFTPTPSATATSTSTPEPDDFIIDGIEVTQSVQTLDNDAPLVANRSTLVRIYARDEQNSGQQVVVSVTGVRDGSLF